MMTMMPTVQQVQCNAEQVNVKEKKVSKAQKRRDKKAEKERERLENIEQQEEENKHGLRHLETEKIKSILASRSLQLKEIPSDGDCLFAGICKILFKYWVHKFHWFLWNLSCHSRICPRIRQIS